MIIVGQKCVSGHKKLQCNHRECILRIYRLITCGCLVIRIIPVSHMCNLGLSTAATSKRLKVDGYRKKNEMKDENQRSS
jgi:hypothetical protein